MISWTPWPKVLLKLVIFCFVITAASIIFNYRVPILASLSWSYTKHNSEHVTSLPCFTQAGVRKLFQRAYQNSVETVSSIFNTSNGSHLLWSQSRMELVRKLSISASLVKMKNVNCMAVVNGSKHTTTQTLNTTLDRVTPICDGLYPKLTANCHWFTKYRGYIMSPLTEEERNFPLAFSILVYKDAEMVERLLRAIYRPQNFYCIHVDRKSPISFFKAVASIANCFTNVVLPSKRVKVVWGEFSVLEPELLCMEELWRFPRWRYFLSLTGQEFPLKTNHELVKILTALNGANDVMSTAKYAKKSRWRNTRPPYGLTPVKGSVHITVNRHFVDFVLHNETAKEILDWTRQTDIPDETFFAVLGANPQLGIPGTYTGEPESSPKRPFLSRYKNWGSRPCAGRFVRDICILSTGDLPLLFSAKELFANKFHLSEDNVVIGCLEEKIFNDTRDEFTGAKIFNDSYYRGLEFVKSLVT